MKVPFSKMNLWRTDDDENIRVGNYQKVGLCAALSMNSDGVYKENRKLNLIAAR